MPLIPIPFEINPNIILEDGKVLADGQPILNIKPDVLHENIVLYKAEKGNFFAPEGWFFLNLVDTNEHAHEVANAAQKVNRPIVFFPGTLARAPNFPVIWKKKMYHKGIIGAVQGQFREGVLHIEYMSVRPSFRRNKVNTAMIDFLKHEFKTDKVTYHELTKEGEAFHKSRVGEKAKKNPIGDHNIKIFLKANKDMQPNRPKNVWRPSFDKQVEHESNYKSPAAFEGFAWDLLVQYGPYDSYENYVLTNTEDDIRGTIYQYKLNVSNLIPEYLLIFEELYKKYSKANPLKKVKKNPLHPEELKAYVQLIKRPDGTDALDQKYYIYNPKLMGDLSFLSKWQFEMSLRSIAFDLGLVNGVEYDDRALGKPIKDDTGRVTRFMVDGSGLHPEKLAIFKKVLSLLQEIEDRHAKNPVQEATIVLNWADNYDETRIPFGDDKDQHGTPRPIEAGYIYHLIRNTLSLADGFIMTKKSATEYKVSGRHLYDTKGHLAYITLHGCDPEQVILFEKAWERLIHDLKNAGQYVEPIVSKNPRLEKNPTSDWGLIETEFQPNPVQEPEVSMYFRMRREFGNNRTGEWSLDNQFHVDSKNPEDFKEKLTTFLAGYWPPSYTTRRLHPESGVLIIEDFELRDFVNDFKMVAEGLDPEYLKIFDRVARAQVSLTPTSLQDQNWLDSKMWYVKKKNPAGPKYGGSGAKSPRDRYKYYLKNFPGANDAQLACFDRIYDVLAEITTFGEVEIVVDPKPGDSGNILITLEAAADASVGLGREDLLGVVLFPNGTGRIDKLHDYSNYLDFLSTAAEDTKEYYDFVHLVDIELPKLLTLPKKKTILRKSRGN